MNLKEQLCNYLIENNLVKEFDVIRHSYSNSRMKEWKKRNVETNNIVPTLDTRCDCLGVVVKEKNMDNLRIRKLTPKECWRLMGFDDEDFEKAEKVNSNTQLYRQAGNSICVPVLEAILKNLNLKNNTMILELFGGIGACSKALERLGIEYKIADYVEIDKYAVKSFNAMHDTNFEPQVYVNGIKT